MEASFIQNSHSSPNQNLKENSHSQPAKYPGCFNCDKSFYIPYVIIPSGRQLKLKLVKTILKEMHHEFN